jgi:hypothetical protein
MTGLGRGYCGGYARPGALGFGRGRGAGFGRGAGYGRGPGYGFNRYADFPAYSPENELSALNNEADFLKNRLEAIKSRISALGKNDNGAESEE